MSVFRLPLVLAVVFAVVLTGCPGPEEPAPEPLYDEDEVAAARVSDQYHYLVTVRALHQEALEHARTISGNTERDEVEELASEIIAQYQAESALLVELASDLYPGEPVEVPHRPIMRDLAAMDEEEGDRIFLEDMVRHHEQVILRSREVLASAEDVDPRVQRHAGQALEVEQQRLEEMRDRLSQWFDVDLPPGTGLEGGDRVEVP